MAAKPVNSVYIARWNKMLFIGFLYDAVDGGPGNYWWGDILYRTSNNKWKMQSSVVITRSNMVTCCINNYRNWDRISIRWWNHKRRARYGVSFVNICEKIDRVITAPRCIFKQLTEYHMSLERYYNATNWVSGWHFLCCRLSRANPVKFPFFMKVINTMSLSIISKIPTIRKIVCMILYLWANQGRWQLWKCTDWYVKALQINKVSALSTTQLVTRI